MTLAPPSLPSLLASETQESIVEYLTTTFALSDPATQTALRDFLGDADTLSLIHISEPTRPY